MIRLNCKSSATKRSCARLNRVIANFLYISIFSVVICIMAGCQTAKTTKPFSAADVLPDTDSMYVKIPVEQNKDICSSIISKYIVGLSEKDCTELIERSETVYASVNFDDKSVNAAIIGNFPVYIDIVFSTQNSWESYRYNKDGHAAFYYVSPSTGFKVAILNWKVMLISSSDIQVLLKRYFSYCDIPETSELLTENVSSTDSIRDKNTVLNNKSPDISFYTSKAGAFIESIIGNGITLAADQASGFFAKDTESKYVLDIEMTFTTKHALKPALFLFKKAGPAGQITTEALSELSMKSTGMTMDIKTIVSLLIGG